MTREDILQNLNDLVDRILQTTSGLDLPRGDQWSSLVVVFLSKANELLDSTRILVNVAYQDSAAIIDRSIFEYAVNLVYIEKDANIRLPQYLKHAGIPLNDEDVEELERKIQQNPTPEVRDVIPGSTWKKLREMCAALGGDWPLGYDTDYRIASVPTHAGASYLSSDYMGLLERRAPSTREKARLLIDAATNHLYVAEIAARTFPDLISRAEVIALVEECGELIRAWAEEGG